MTVLQGLPLPFSNGDLLSLAIAGEALSLVGAQTRMMPNHSPRVQKV
jgi:hypothetical protein